MIEAAFAGFDQLRKSRATAFIVTDGTGLATKFR